MAQLPSVAPYIVVPVLLAQGLRRARLAYAGPEGLVRGLTRCHPVPRGALLATLVLLFGFQGGRILAEPLMIVLLAVAIAIQVYFNSALAYLLNRVSSEAHCVAVPSALIGSSNFFELAVAAAISLFGLRCGAALATVVGVRVEVPAGRRGSWRGRPKALRESLARFSDEDKKLALGDPYYVNILMRRLVRH